MCECVYGCFNCNLCILIVVAYSFFSFVRFKNFMFVFCFKYLFLVCFLSLSALFHSYQFQISWYRFVLLNKLLIFSLSHLFCLAFFCLLNIFLFGFAQFYRVFFFVFIIFKFIISIVKNYAYKWESFTVGL